jgi:hypothetical protein
MSLESQATELGIPMQIRIDDKTRYSYCDAHMANLASIEGKHAIYKGECANGHVYEVRRLIAELQQEVVRSAQIINGEVVVGDGKSFAATDLEEY